VAWMQKNQDLVENEKMVLNCSVTGHPIPDIVWKFGMSNISLIFDLILTFDYSENTTIDSTTDRITLESHGKLKNAILMIENITLEDKGNYTCHASILSGAREASAYTIVRIKGNFFSVYLPRFLTVFSR
jgi:neuroplastin